MSHFEFGGITLTLQRRVMNRKRIFSPDDLVVRVVGLRWEKILDGKYKMSNDQDKGFDGLLYICLIYIYLQGPER